jgi:DNA-binding CsgD family transcriptional regulator
MKVSQQKLEALSQAIRELYRPMGAAELPLHLVTVLKKIIPAEFVAYNEFPTEDKGLVVVFDSGSSPVAASLLPVFERYMLENPLIERLLTPGSVLPPARITDYLPLADYQRTNVYNEVYEKIGAARQLGCKLRLARGGLVGLALNRQKRNFGDEEVFLLGILHPHIEQAFDLAEARESAKRSLFSVLERNDRRGGGILCFDDHLRVTHLTPAVGQLITACLGCRAVESQPLPGALRELALRLMKEGGEIPGPPGPVELTGAEGQAVTVRFIRDGEGLNHGLVFEPESGLYRPEQLNRLGLSPRETEIAFWVLQQKTSWEIGKILHLSSRTAEKHKENIFRKLDIENRGELMTKARRLCDL